jgi:DNA-binding NtrC family response regulator
MEVSTLKQLVSRPGRSSISEMLIGQSASMQALRRALERLATAPSTGVILRGEPGSGKRTTARALHETTGNGELLEPSGRREVEAALKFSGPATVYLGELTYMPSSLKVKIRRALYGRRQGDGVRYVAAISTHPGLTARAGDLLPSLLHRFGVTLDVPPLRERLEDLPLLTQHLLARLALEHGLTATTLSARTIAELRDVDWTGNVRQLENTLKRALLLASPGIIEPAHLPGQARDARYRLPAEGIDLQALERELLLQALRRARGNRTRAGSLLGLTRDQVRYRLAKLEPSNAGGNYQ